MATWCLECGNCLLSFADSVIPDDALRGIFFSPKPVLPVGGSEFQCPHCSHRAMYESSDFILSRLAMPQRPGNIDTGARAVETSQPFRGEVSLAPDRQHRPNCIQPF
jgi:hypothetical protein